MNKQDDKKEENLGTTQMGIEESVGKFAHSTKKWQRQNIGRNTGNRMFRTLRTKLLAAQKSDRDKTMKEIPENVRIRKEAVARCTKVIKRKMLKKQPRKARADHLVKCSLKPGRRKIKKAGV